MNAEFARGMFVYLDSYARVSSTFGGHYDLAAYLTLLMPMLLGAHYFFEGKMQRYFTAFVYRVKPVVEVASIPSFKLSYQSILFGLFLFALFIMSLTASRTSYISYVVSVGAMLVFLRKPKMLLAVLSITIALTFLSDDLKTRFARTFQVKSIFENAEGGITIGQNGGLELPAGSQPIDNIFNSGENIAGKTVGKPGPNGYTQEQLDALRQIRESLEEEARKRGLEINDEEIAAESARQLAQLKQRYAWLPDISLSTRTMVEWPRAIAAFKANPVLGSGPSSITEATDGDYFRWLGEIGLLGSGAFLYILYSIASMIWLAAKKNTRDSSLYYGFLFGFFGLMINATYIDVFEASKVAFTFWFIAGLFVGKVSLDSDTVVEKNV